MKEKLSNIIFIAVFLAALIVPALFINREPLQISEIDNELLTEWPGLDFTMSNVEELENYVDDRIGFREQVVSAYIYLNDRLFHVMTHPLFMYGEEGHIYYKDPSYITAYQRLNTNEKWIDGFVEFLSQTNDYLKSKNIDFLYYLCPDKKTIYPEFFPKSVNVNTKNKTVPGYIEEKLKETDIDYIIPIEELTEAKKEKVVYNKLYDATHWNEDGAFLGHKLIDEKVQSEYEDVPILSEESFDRQMRLQETLDIARFPIHEEVPIYVPKNDTANNMTTYMLPVIDCYTPTFYAHFTDETCGNNRILLIFTDSYFATYLKFYQNRFSEVYFVHRQNFEYIQYYINLLFPDMVIFETAERSVSGEMMEQAAFSDRYVGNLILQTPEDIGGEPLSNYSLYEAPFDGDLSELKTDGGPEYIISGVKGVKLSEDEDGKRLLLNVNEGESIVSLTGYVRGEGRDYDIYAQIGDEAIVETDYLALRHRNEDPSLKAFSVNVQRRYLSEMDIKLFAVDTQTDESYLLDTFKVRYAQ
ncbi:MAG: hypothetical protein K5770_11150 [Lachnospiraceae bacterium]|nr:hypothetical protein [Lachnospiraceae bacterium]